MKIYDDKVIPAVPEKRVKKCVYAICDICGVARTNEEPIVYSGECNWAKESFEVSTTTVARESGGRFPEGGEVKVEAYHVCPKCFTDYLIPYLAEFRKEDDKSTFPHVDDVDF